LRHQSALLTFDSSAGFGFRLSWWQYEHAALIAQDGVSWYHCDTTDRDGFVQSAAKVAS
jgi:hypothetical protein